MASDSRADGKDPRYDFGPSLKMFCSKCKKKSLNRGDKETGKVLCLDCYKLLQPHGVEGVEAQTQDSPANPSEASTAACSGAARESAISSPRVVALKVEIIKATGLPAKDPRIVGGKSDPYCVCRIKKKKEELRTPTIFKELDPEWNYEGRLIEFQREDELIFSVYDQDRWPKSDDFLGEATLHGSTVLDKHGFNGELELQVGSGSKKPPLLSVRVVPEQVTEEVKRIAKFTQLCEDAQQLFSRHGIHSEDSGEHRPAFDGRMPDALLFQGGGTKGIVYAGAVKRLEEEFRRQRKVAQLTDAVKHIAGSSAGSQAAALVAFGYSGKQFEDVMKHAPWSKLFDNSSFFGFGSLLNLMCLPGECMNLGRLFTTYGFNKGEFLERYLNDLFEHVPTEECPGGFGKRPDGGRWTFQDLKERTGIDLKLGVTNITTGEFEFLCAETHPDMPVSLAATASSSIPFVFPPVKWRGNQYVDGGVEGNLPLRAFEGMKCMAFTLISRNSERTRRRLDRTLKGCRNFVTFAERLLTILRDATQSANGYDPRLSRHYASRGIDIIEICTGDAGALDTSMSPEELEEMVKHGCRAVDSYFSVGDDGSFAQGIRGLMHDLSRSVNFLAKQATSATARLDRDVSKVLREAQPAENV